MICCTSVVLSGLAVNICVRYPAFGGSVERSKRCVVKSLNLLMAADELELPWCFVAVVFTLLGECHKSKSL